jgi:hypothetical protein
MGGCRAVGEPNTTEKKKDDQQATAIRTAVTAHALALPPWRATILFSAELAAAVKNIGEAVQLEVVVAAWAAKFAAPKVYCTPLFGRIFGDMVGLPSVFYSVVPAHANIHPRHVRQDTYALTPPSENALPPAPPGPNDPALRTGHVNNNHYVSLRPAGAANNNGATPSVVASAGAAKNNGAVARLDDSHQGCR